MYIAGGAVVIVGVIAHGNYSDHSDYSRYSDYAERERRLREEERRRKIEILKQEINREKENLSAAAQEAIASFKSDELLLLAYEKIKANESEQLIRDEFADDPDAYKNKMLQAVEKELEKILEEDKQRLVEIDKVIMRINEMQLKYDNSK